MNTQLLYSKVQEYATLLDEKKGQEIIALDVSNHNLPFDAVLIVTAMSSRHAQSLATGVLDYSGKHGYEYLRMEGYTNGTWILLDLNDIIVHIFKAEERVLYTLESLWDAPHIPLVLHP